MRTWIVGDSLINWAGQYSPQLQGGGDIKWKGLGGARVGGLSSRISSYLAKSPFPTTLIVHLGTNNILVESTRETRQSMEENLYAVRQLLPNSRIIWSDILPRMYYHGENTAGAGKRCTINLNKCAHQIGAQLGMYYINHSHAFPPQSHHLYRRDGLHMSELGNAMLRKNLEESLLFFNSNPEISVFIPKPHN